MPYIIPDARENLSLSSSGDLNYFITRTCHDYLDKHKLCYATLNDIIGVLECAKLEFYRQIVSPYEDKKKEENGPVSRFDV